MASDFELLGVKSVADLARCAVAQAKDPQLPLERCY